MQYTGSPRAFVWGSVFGVLAAVLLWSRLAGLDLAFWHDEVVTVIRYAGPGPGMIYFGDYIPNNHVLFSLLAWMTTSLTSDSEVMFRFWGFVPALVGTGWLSWWLSCRFGLPAGAMVLLLVTVSPVIFQVSREARGYGLAVLAMAGLLIQADSALADPGSAAVWRFLAFGLLGVVTLPVFVLPLVASALPLVLKAPLRRRVTAGMAVTGLLSLVWYAPLLSGIVAHADQQFGQPVVWHGAVTMSMEQLVFPAARLLLPGQPDILVSTIEDPLVAVIVWHVVAWGLITLAAFGLWRGGHHLLLLVLALPVVLTYTVLALMGAWAVDRHVSYLSVPLFVLLALGINELVGLTRKRGRTGLMVGLAIVAAWTLVSFYPVALNVTQVPKEATKEVAEFTTERGYDEIITNSARPEGLRYYLQAPLEVLSPDELEARFCSQESGFAYIDHPFKAPTVDTSCLQDREAERIRFEQRGRGDWIDAWFVGAPDGA